MHLEPNKRSRPSSAGIKDLPMNATAVSNPEAVQLELPELVDMTEHRVTMAKTELMGLLDTLDSPLPSTRRTEEDASSAPLGHPDPLELPVKWDLRDILVSLDDLDQLDIPGVMVHPERKVVPDDTEVLAETGTLDLPERQE